MDIILFDVNSKMTECWKKDFADKKNVFVLNAEFAEIMRGTNLDIDMVVSAANSFGIMDGGLDLAYREYFGKSLQDEVQSEIQKQYLGEQPVGTSMTINIPGFSGIKLCHTPTMRTPQPVDPRVVYSAMRSTLVEAYKCGARAVMIPAFAHMTGRVDAYLVSTLMLRAYEDFVDSIKCGNKPRTWAQIYSSKNIDDVLIGRFVF